MQHYCTHIRACPQFLPLASIISPTCMHACDILLLCHVIYAISNFEFYPCLVHDPFILLDQVSFYRWFRACCHWTQDSIANLRSNGKACGSSHTVHKVHKIHIRKPHAAPPFDFTMALLTFLTPFEEQLALLQVEQTLISDGTKSLFLVPYRFLCFGIFTCRSIMAQSPCSLYQVVSSCYVVFFF